MLKANKNWIKHTVIIATACASMNVLAEESSVWNDSTGDVTKDGAGDCLRTIWWQKDSTCGTPAPAKQEVKAAPAPAPVAAPAPAPAPAAVVKSAPFSLSSAASFELSGAELSAAGKAEIKAFADKLEGHDVSNITVEGYTDSSGAAAFNQTLSEKRANAVKDEMVKNDIDASLITVIGHGENDPIADNATSEGRAQNRRVTVTVEGSKIIE